MAYLVRRAHGEELGSGELWVLRWEGSSMTTAGDHIICVTASKAEAERIADALSFSHHKIGVEAMARWRQWREAMFE